MDVPAAVKRLRLSRAFRGYSPGILECINISNNTKIYVIDDDILKVSRFAEESEMAYGGFCAENTETNDIILLPIDNCLMSNIPDGIADCAIFDERLFAFVEFKAKAQGNSPQSREDTYRKAISQIENTLSIFTRLINMVKLNFAEEIEIIGVVVVSPKFPRSNATEQNLMTEFILRNGLELSFEPIRKYS